MLTDNVLERLEKLLGWAQHMSAHAVIVLKTCTAKPSHGGRGISPPSTSAFFPVVASIK